MARGKSLPLCSEVQNPASVVIYFRGGVLICREPLVVGHVYASHKRGRVVSSRAEGYRRRAQQCIEMAAAFKSPQARASLVYMAEVWLRLADNYKARPVVQQQQQIQPKGEDKKE